VTAKRLALGDPIPSVPRGAQPIEVGWHPACGHVRHMAVGQRHSPRLNPTLIYGVLPRGEVRERLGECATCRPPEQLGFLAALGSRPDPGIAGGGSEDE
jgi:hypothetical protein